LLQKGSPDASRGVLGSRAERLAAPKDSDDYKVVVASATGDPVECSQNEQPALGPSEETLAVAPPPQRRQNVPRYAWRAHDFRQAEA
jgi:hypothetical protein